MAKETKQDRTVRGMIDAVIEHLHELKSLDSNPGSKESDVEKWCASFIKSCLGYASSSSYAIRSQESKGKLRPDLIVLKDEKPLFLVEVKKLGFDFDKSAFRSGKIQLSEYLNAAGGVKYGILTNGTEWKLYDFTSPQYGGIEIARFDLKPSEGETYSFDKRSIEDLCYEMFDFHESSFSSKYWDDLAKEATAFSPESLAKAILSADVVKYIGKSIRGEHEYKANLEVLTDKVFNLLEEGLNDAILGWNDAKASELQKYVKSQKRVSRKTKKKKEAPSISAQPETTQSTTADVETGSEPQTASKSVA